MKHLKSIVWLISWTSFAVAAAGFAQAASDGSGRQTGVIEGRIQNAATGRYLNNARVIVKGTNLAAFTDEAGSYRIVDVPAGSIVLEATYTGLDPKDVSLTVPAGQSVRRDLSLTSAAIYGKQDGITELDPFQVNASREMDSATIAINEQRVAPNIKTVVSTGDLSEHADSNIAEFLKSMPGVAANGDDRASSTLYIRGFPPNLTVITLDGASLANPALSSNTRTLSMSEQMSSDNIARVELTKVPTPATGADTMAGSINMVSKSAFESSRASFRYQLNLAGDLGHFSLKPVASAWQEDLYYVRPSLSFTYTLPATENFGIVVTGTNVNRWTPQERSTPGHTTSSATFGASIAKPMTSGANYLTAAGLSARSSIALKADWRVRRDTVLSAGIQTYFREFLNSNYQFNLGTGTNATSTVAGGVAGSYNETNTLGATGRGSLSFANNFTQRETGGYRGDLRYLFTNGNWKIDLQFGQSDARLWNRNIENGQFNSVVVATTIPFRVEFRDIDPVRGPGRISVFNNANQELDVHDPSIHNFTTITQATTNPRDVRDTMYSYKADIRRRLGFLPVPAFVQVGGARKDQTRDFAVRSNNYTYRGINGNLSPMPYVTQYEVLRYDPSGRPAPLVSPHLAWQAWQKDPGLFYQTPAQVAAGVQAARLNSELIQEVADALYFQGEAHFLHNRLTLLTGVRYEKTTGKGAGSLNTPDAVWQRRADGSYALTASGARIRKPEAGTSGSLQEIELTWHERAARTKRTYDGYYPSLHLTYNFTEKLLARAAYAKTYGRPDFSFIIPRTVVSEFTDSDGDVSGGRLTVRNPGLLPWTADNYDLTLEYYTDQGGVFSAGLFRKDIKDFFDNQTRPATPGELTEAGLDPNLVGWEVVTTANVGAAKVEGFEVSYEQSLRPLDPWLGGWGQYIRVFANVTKLDISGPAADSFTNFVPTNANWGFQFRKKRVGASLKWNYRSDETYATVTNIGTNGINYYPARTHLDVNLSYSLRPNLSVFTNLRNVTGQKIQRFKSSNDLPTYARMINITNFGVSFNVGVNGSF
jgi:TonB-dependent receptor